MVFEWFFLVVGFLFVNYELVCLNYCGDELERVIKVFLKVLNWRINSCCYLLIDCLRIVCRVLCLVWSKEYVNVGSVFVERF